MTRGSGSPFRGALPVVALGATLVLLIAILVGFATSTFGQAPTSARARLELSNAEPVPQKVTSEASAGARTVTARVQAAERPDPQQPATRPQSPSQSARPKPNAPADPELPVQETTPAVVPASPSLPGEIAQIACVSGDMVDIITFSAPVEGSAASSFVLYASASSDGDFSVVATAAADTRSITRSVSTTGAAWYKIAAVNSAGEGRHSELVENDHVSITSQVGRAGAELRSSNGEVILALPEGAFETSTTVGIEEVSGSPLGGMISLAGIYEITPSGALGAPASLAIAYKLDVSHFQVAETILKAASLVTYDSASAAWVPETAGIVAESGYLVGSLSHFSYWSVATVQPHGTTGSTVNYCSGLCHDLSTSPGSAVRYDSRDSQVCYHCHGNTDPASPPAGAYPEGRNIEAEFFQIDGFPPAARSSWHPVETGRLYCTACHDPHADPESSPGLLKAWNPLTGRYLQGSGGVAPGTEFCWTCHGPANNKRIGYIVPDYWMNSGGDKKTGFNGAHTAVRTAVERYETVDEFSRGYMLGTQVTADATVSLDQTPGELAKAGVDAVATPAVTGNWGGSGGKAAYDGDWTNTKLYWNAGAMGASAGNGWIGAASLTIDLGSITQVESFDMLFLNNLGCVPDVIEVETSNTGVDGPWTPLVTQGALGVHPSVWDASLSGSAACRYVRIVFRRDFTNPYGDPSTELVAVTEISINGVPSSGTYTIRPDVAQKTTYAGGTVRWNANVLPYHTFVVEARGSVDNGTTWTSWQPVTNGGPIAQIPIGASLERALLQVRVTLGTSVVGDSPLLGMIEITTVRGAITGATPAWTGGSRPNECLTCHVSHGADRPGLVTTATTAACKQCHAGTYGSSYVGKAQFEASAHSTVPCGDCHTAHGKANGSGPTYRFLLKDVRSVACISADCHAQSVGVALSAKQGSGSEWAKHDVSSAEQTKSGSTIACRNCHGTHYSSTGLVNPDTPTSAFTTMVDDPTLIDTAEMVIPASRDTVLDSANPTLNYGASTQVSISDTKRALLYFDLSTLPANVTIQNATLVLWPSDPDYHTYNSSYCEVFPVTRDWAEGSGTGTPNSAGINGATWAEWRFGSAWSVSGGDVGAVSGSAQQGHARDVTALVRSLYQGPNYGMMVGKLSGYPSAVPIYMDEHSAGSKFSPHLRIVYQTGRRPGPQVLDDATFCLKCHDGGMPFGLKAQTGISSIMASWNATSNGNSHGKTRGIGPESDIRSFYSVDPGGGSLRFPYSYGMDALSCSTCHDPHGSPFPYHLKQFVNGRDMTPIFSDWDAVTAGEERASAWFCGACHIHPQGHAGYENSETGTCVPCHRGGH